MGLSLSCASTSDPATGDLIVDLHHRDPQVRIEAARRSAKDGRRDLVPLLIGNLADRDESVRFFTSIALQRLTGQDLGFRSFGSYQDREQAIARWRAWLESVPGLNGPGLNGPGSGGPPMPDGPQPVKAIHDREGSTALGSSAKEGP